MPRLSLVRWCLAALVGLAVLWLLGGRSFASAVVNLHRPAVLTSHRASPIPFILDRKAPKKPAVSRVSRPMAHGKQE